MGDEEPVLKVVTLYISMYVVRTMVIREMSEEKGKKGIAEEELPHVPILKEDFYFLLPFHLPWREGEK